MEPSEQVELAQIQPEHLVGKRVKVKYEHLGDSLFFSSGAEGRVLREEELDEVSLSSVKEAAEKDIVWDYVWVQFDGGDYLDVFGDSIWACREEQLEIIEE